MFSIKLNNPVICDTFMILANKIATKMCTSNTDLASEIIQYTWIGFPIWCRGCHQVLPAQGCSSAFLALCTHGPAMATSGTEKAPKHLQYECPLNLTFCIKYLHWPKHFEQLLNTKHFKVGSFQLVPLPGPSQIFCWIWWLSWRLSGPFQPQWRAAWPVWQGPSTKSGAHSFEMCGPDYKRSKVILRKYFQFKYLSKFILKNGDWPKP